MASGISKLLVKTLVSQDTSVLAQSALTIGRLSRHPKFSQQLASSGALPLLLTLIVSEDPEVQVRIYQVRELSRTCSPLSNFPLHCVYPCVGIRSNLSFLF